MTTAFQGNAFQNNAFQTGAGDTHDYAENWKKHRKRLKKLQQATARFEAEKIEQAKRLRAQIEDARHPKTIERIEITAPHTEERITETIVTPESLIKARDLEYELQLLSTQILLLAEQNKELSKRLREEDDIRALLLLID